MKKIQLGQKFSTGGSFLYFFNQFNASSQIQTKIDEDPDDSLPLVFFLFQYEHVMVEKLLEFLVDKIDPKLFEAIELKTVQTSHKSYCEFVEKNTSKISNPAISSTPMK